jgi:ABC-type multidrug transport system fused ATPase/permease subunit
MEPTATAETPASPQPQSELILGASAKYFLTTAGRWANFLSIMGFIGTGFILLAVVFIGGVFEKIPALAMSGVGSNGFPIISVIVDVVRFVYVLIAVLNFFGAFYLNQFASKIKNGVLFNDSVLATGAFENLKSFLKLVGITVIVCISIDVLAFIAAIVAAAGLASVMH